MTRYLDKFRSTLPAVQVSQINKLLNTMKNDGVIKTIKEYNQKLQELTTILQGTDPTPSFKLLLAYVGDIISSARFNTMTQATANDLEAAFLEAQNIAEILETHKAIFDLTVLDSVEKSINEIERNIDLYEYLANSPHKFSDAQYITFNETESVFTPRTDEEAGNLYFDYRLTEQVGEEEDCEIDTIGECLLLPSGNVFEVDVVDVSLIHDSATTFPAADLEISTQNINNICDGQLYTYWIYPLFSKEKIEAARIKLRLNLGGQRRFNSIYIEPQSTHPMILESFSYIDINGETHTVSNLNFVVPPTRMIYLGNLETNILVLTFKQENSVEVVYHYDDNKDEWSAVYTNMDQEIKSVISNPITQEILDLDDNQELIKERSGYQYSFGFDNIRLYLTEYRDRGIFVSKKLSVKKPLSIALQVDEQNETLTEFAGNQKRFSFEYLLLKKNFNENGGLIDTEIVPILPMGEEDISDERLFLVTHDEGDTANNIAYLRFVPEIVGEVGPTIRLNHGGSSGTALQIGTEESGKDFQVAVDGDNVWKDSWSALKTTIDEQPETLVPILIKIKFHNPNQNGFYTSSYTASRRISSSSNQRKLSRDISLLDNCILRCFIEKPGNNLVDQSDLYLIIIMRNNWISVDTSCALNQYKLLVSRQDDNKYIG